ncbi:MAG: DNA-binding protein [Deltaproteobacteria bacterium]|nr:MAG: DNA-binding protein [Deltaproteobacteria bacterium]
MKGANRISAWDFKAGRCMLGRLPYRKDLIAAVEDFCANHAIEMAVFSIIGSVTSATLGGYDQNQQVYVTFKKEEALEIVHCIGNVSLKDGKVAVHAHAVFADINGRTIGGHIFSETVVYAGEIYIQELLGKPLQREYDDTTGLLLWRL